MSKRLLLNFLAVAVCALCLCSTALAQFNASLSGTVQDSTGAVVANATVTLVNLGTNQTQTTVTPNTGFYRFGQLPPGHYKLTATAAGFKGYTIADVNIAAETARSVNVNLAPGEATDTVNVTADQTPVLQTADASIGSTIDSEQIHRLPVFGANPYELLRTIPGIAGDSARSGAGQAIFLPNASGPNGSNSGVFQTENQTQISANGQRAADNNYTLDGVSVNSLSHGGAAVVTPNQEAIGQMTVLSTSYDAADGRNTGAQIKSITKNGTNDMHGSLFFLYDEPGLNAYNKWGGPTPGSLRTRAENKQRNWIASLGGPIAKDKLFYFFSWQGYTQVSNSYASQGWVETSAFRSLIQATRPGSVGSALFSTAGLDPRYVKVLNRGCADYSANQSMYPGQTDTNGLWCRAVGNGIDVGSPTAGGATQIGQYPTYRRFDPLDPLQATNPNLPSQEEVGGGLDNVADLQYVQFFKPGHSRGNQWNARGDWQITSSDLLAGSVYFTKLDNLTAPNNDSRPQGDIPFKPLNSAATILWIHTFSSAWINEFRANGTRFKDDQLADSGSLVNYGIPEIHLEGLPYTSANASAPQIQFGVPQGSGGSFAQNTIEFRDTVTHTFGSHILKAGVEFRFEQDNDDTVSSHARPVYSLRGLWNLANDTPVFEGIVANPNTGGAPSLATHLRSNNYAAFVQHDWKITPQFTLNTGLRWEHFTPLRNKEFAMNYPVLGSTPGRELTDIRLTPHATFWNAQFMNFAPKVGFAFAPASLNHKMVIHGGFAMAYNHLDFALFNIAQLDNGPGLANYNLCCGTSTDGTGTPFAHGAISYHLGTSNSFSSYPANPALATGTNATTGFPNPYNGGTPGTEVYGAFPNTKVPYSYLYSLDTQYELPQQMSLTIGYAGSLGRHYARLVNQRFIYSTASTPAGSVYMAQTDSVTSYNGFNVILQRHMKKGLAASVAYTWSKSLDQVSNGDYADGAANQTNPANNATEYGPSDYDTRHRVVATVNYELPKHHGGNGALNAVINGWQINSIITYHTGFPWTPSTTNLNAPGANSAADTVNPTRPLAYYGGAGNSCSSSTFETGGNFPNGGPSYFNTTPLPGGTKDYVPGIGRNSFRGPCYTSVDMSFAKEIAFDSFAHHNLFRFQANMYNAFNILSLQPLNFGTSAVNIADPYFGHAQGANSGRVVEFSARLQF